MAGSAILEVIVEVVGQALVETIFYFTGKVLTPVLSFGRWHPASLADGEKIKFPRWGGLYTDDGGRALVSPDGQALLGFLFYVFLLVCFVFYHQLT